MTRLTYLLAAVAIVALASCTDPVDDTKSSAAGTPSSKPATSTSSSAPVKPAPIDPAPIDPCSLLVGPELENLGVPPKKGFQFPVAESTLVVCQWADADALVSVGVSQGSARTFLESLDKGPALDIEAVVVAGRDGERLVNEKLCAYAFEVKEQAVGVVARTKTAPARDCTASEQAFRYVAARLTR